MFWKNITSLACEELSSVCRLFGDITKVSSMRCLFGDIREASLSDEGDDSDKVFVHEDWMGESEKGKKIIIKKKIFQSMFPQV